MQGADVTKDNVVTLMCDPEQFTLNDKEVGSVVDALAGHGGIVTDVQWLVAGEACDIYFAVLSVEDAQQMLKHLLEPVPLDFIVQKAYTRKKKLLITDMDSTVIEQECIDELADYVGLKEEIAAITARAMNGELDFVDALLERVSKLKGLTEQQLQQAYDERITFMPGARELVATMKANNAFCILVSGGFTFFTTKVRDALGFDIDESNRLVIEDGVLIGEVKQPVVDKQSKRDALSFYSEKYNIGQDETLAVGDGANDLPMLLEASMGVAYHAKPVVKMQARAKIDYCDLRALLYAQGYTSEGIVST